MIDRMVESAREMAADRESDVVVEAAREGVEILI
jgi:hypothetical protein